MHIPYSMAFRRVRPGGCLECVPSSRLLLVRPPPVKFQNGGFGAIPLESLEALVGSVMTKSLLAHITPSSWERISPMLSFRTC